MSRASQIPIAFAQAGGAEERVRGLRRLRGGIHESLERVHVIGIRLDECDLEVGGLPIGVAGEALHDLAEGGDGFPAAAEGIQGQPLMIEGCGIGRVAEEDTVKGRQGRRIVPGVVIGQAALEVVHRHTVIHQGEQALERIAGGRVVRHGLRVFRIGCLGLPGAVQRATGQDQGTGPAPVLVGRLKDQIVLLQGGVQVA